MSFETQHESERRDGKRRHGVDAGVRLSGDESAAAAEGVAEAAKAADVVEQLNLRKAQAEAGLLWLAAGTPTGEPEA